MLYYTFTLWLHFVPNDILGRFYSLCNAYFLFGLLQPLNDVVSLLKVWFYKIHYEPVYQIIFIQLKKVT